MKQNSKSQILITGVYRTGSEYLTQLINCHSAISATMYRVNVLRFIYNQYNPISSLENQKKALNDLEQRLQKRYQLTLNQDEIFQMLQQYEEVSYGILYDVIMTSLYLNSPELNHWAEKNQLLWREIPTFLKLMPNGKTILVVRDPRSVLASFKNMTYADPPAYLGAIFNCFDSMKHAKQYQSELSTDRFMCVRYEDIAQNPKEWSQKIWKFLDLQGEADLEQQHWVDSYGNSWRTNSSFHDKQDSSPFEVENAINRWKEFLSKGEISLTEGICGKLMEDFKYDLSIPSPDWLNAIKLFAHDDKIMNHFRNWLIDQVGIQAFPTDPTSPKNWSEHRC